jgi:hypothetical protein
MSLRGTQAEISLFAALKDVTETTAVKLFVERLFHAFD